MLIWNKPKSVTIDCFTPVQAIADNAPIAHAKEVTPKFFKELNTPKKDPNLVTAGIKSDIKDCQALIDINNRGIVVPLWCSLLFQGNFVEDEKGFTDYHHKWSITDANYSGMQPFNPLDWGVDSQKVHNMKQIYYQFKSPWRIKSNKYVQFIQTNTFWHHMSHDFFVMNGVLDYYHQNAVSCIYAIGKKKDQEVELPAGTPVMQILPLEKINLKIKIHCVTEQEWNKLAPYFMFWNKNALRLRKIRK